MSSYKARYQGSNEEVLSEGASPRMAAKNFLEKVGYKPIPVEVWNDRWIILFFNFFGDSDFVCEII